MSPLEKTVLVVEDDHVSTKLFREALEAHGYNVLHMTTAPLE